MGPWSARSPLRRQGVALSWPGVCILLFEPRVRTSLLTLLNPVRVTCRLHPRFLCCVVRLEVPSLWPGSWEAPRRGLGRTAQHGPSREELLGTGAAAGRRGVWVSGLVSVFFVAGLLFVFCF